jgi:uncharacterized protein YjdB
MKKLLFAIAALALVTSCTPEENDIVHVTGISLDRSSATIKEGGFITLAATVTPSDADNKTVSWSSSSDAVATVDASGKVTGVKAGSATITATAEDGGMKATCAISVEANLAPSVTVEANHISAISAVLAGKANLGSTLAADFQLGFQYSKSAGILPANSTTVEASDADADYNFITAITGLEPDTKYYFRSFVRQNSQYTYGETKSFTTKDAVSLLETGEASGIEATKATLNAKLDLTDVGYSSIDYGFYWGSSEEEQNNWLNGGEINGDVFSASITGLPHKTKYWYKAYVKLDNQSFYGVVKSFTTNVVPVECVSLDKTEYTLNTIGNTITLTATVLPADATDKSVEWLSDKEDVATVDQNGKVTAVGNGLATITVMTKDQGKTATCVLTVAQYVTGISLNKSSISLIEGEEETLTATVNPDDAADKTLKWTSSDDAVATVDQTGKVTAVSEGDATIKATANDNSGVSIFCLVVVHRAVDMGTVVNGKNIRWATCNIGASSPEESGLYYAWGETEPKSNYDWSTYRWCNVYGALVKYNTSSPSGIIDNKTVLDPEDDVAHVKLGGKWRMPTDEEWTALRTQCTWVWTTQNGVSGRLVTASNGNSIFLPAAGTRSNTGQSIVGRDGYYWSSSLNTDDSSKAWWMHFYLDTALSRGSSGRCYGKSVRPVTD